MQTRHRPSRHDGIVTKWQQRPGAIVLLVLTACLSSLVFAGSAASANESSCANQYPGDPGFVATSPSALGAAKASWETPEYGYFTGHNPSTPGTAVNSPWQLVAVNASTAYALGYCGQGVKLGMMDSGYRTTHEAFQTAADQSGESRGSLRHVRLRVPWRDPVEPVHCGSSRSLSTVIRRERAITRTGPACSGSPPACAMVRTSTASPSGRTCLSPRPAVPIPSPTVLSTTTCTGTRPTRPWSTQAPRSSTAVGARSSRRSTGPALTVWDAIAEPTATVANAYQLPGKDSASATAMASIIPNEYLKDLEYQYFLFKKSYSPGGHQYNPNYPGTFLHGCHLGGHQGQRYRQREVGRQ